MEAIKSELTKMEAEKFTPEKPLVNLPEAEVELDKTQDVLDENYEKFTALLKSNSQFVEICKKVEVAKQKLDKVKKQDTDCNARLKLNNARILAIGTEIENTEKYETVEKLIKEKSVLLIKIATDEQWKRKLIHSEPTERGKTVLVGMLPEAQEVVNNLGVQQGAIWCQAGFDIKQKEVKGILDSIKQIKERRRLWSDSLNRSRNDYPYMVFESPEYGRVVNFSIGGADWVDEG